MTKVPAATDGDLTNPTLSQYCRIARQPRPEADREILSLSWDRCPSEMHRRVDFMSAGEQADVVTTEDVLGDDDPSGQCVQECLIQSRGLGYGDPGWISEDESPEQQLPSDMAVDKAPNSHIVKPPNHRKTLQLRRIEIKAQAYKM